MVARIEETNIIVSQFPLLSNNFTVLVGSNAAKCSSADGFLECIPPAGSGANNPVVATYHFDDNDMNVLSEVLHYSYSGML